MLCSQLSKSLGIWYILQDLILPSGNELNFLVEILKNRKKKGKKKEEMVSHWAGECFPDADMAVKASEFIFIELFLGKTFSFSLEL